MSKKSNVAEFPEVSVSSPELPTQLDNSDLQYHGFVLNQLQSAQVAANSWSNFVVQKYGLGQKDQIDMSGRIVRASGSAEVVNG